MQEIVGKPRGRTTIVPPNEILTLQSMENEENWCLASLLENTHDTITALQWCARRGLIRNTLICANCLHICTFQKYSRGIDLYRWVCSRCGSKKSLREGSFFSRSHLQIQQILVMVYIWCCDDSQHQMSREAQVKDKNIIGEWCKFMRDECTAWLSYMYLGLGGTDENGEAIVVEINEPKYYHRKHRRGHHGEGYWVFGGIERESGKCFLVELPNNKTETLIACIIDHFLPGTYIVSGNWASHANIERIDQGIYQHTVVDPNDSFTHIKNVENLWKQVERKLKIQLGNDRGNSISYLYELMYRSHFQNNDIFKHFIITLRQNHQINCFL